MNDSVPSRLPYRLGVGAVVTNGQGLVFVAKRIDTPGEAWQLPQGGIDKDEDPRIAVLRELKEEIGTDNVEIVAESRDWLVYDLPDDLVGKVWKGRYRGQRQKWYLLRFLGKDSDIDLSGDGHPEFSDWKWVPLNSIPSAIVGFKRPLYDAIVAEFKALIRP